MELAAIARQIDDLSHAHQRGLVWDEDEVQRNLWLVRQLKHWKGRHRGRHFEPEPWQEHLVFAPVWGWFKGKPRSQAGERRYNTCYLEIPRKNGKTFTASAMGVQGLIGDMEYGAEVYATATTQVQATILFKDVVNTTKGTTLEKFIKYQRHALMCPKLNGILRALASDSHSLDGLNPSLGIADELHEQKNRNLWDVINEGMAARDNPLMIGITTAGVDRSSICWELRNYLESVLTSHVQDDSFYGLICCAEPEDDIEDPETWWKANPNLGVSVRREFLAKESAQAARSPSKENNFRRKHLNQWTQQDVRWIVMRDWDACHSDMDNASLIGRPCYAGLDLAATKDVSAFSVLWPMDDGSYVVRCMYWVPEASAQERARSDRREVLNWVNQGFIKSTKGNVVDYAAIRRDIMEFYGTHDLRGLAYDPGFAGEPMIQALQEDGFPLRDIHQYKNHLGNMCAPSYEFEKLVSSGQLRHNGDPVLRWMAGNVTVTQDASGRIRPDKSKSSEKIDGIVATIMALGLATKLHNKNQPGGFAFYGAN